MGLCIIFGAYFYWVMTCEPFSYKTTIIYVDLIIVILQLVLIIDVFRRIRKDLKRMLIPTQKCNIFIVSIGVLLSVTSCSMLFLVSYFFMNVMETDWQSYANIIVIQHTLIQTGLFLNCYVFFSIGKEAYRIKNLDNDWQNHDTDSNSDVSKNSSNSGSNSDSDDE